MRLFLSAALVAGVLASAHTVMAADPPAPKKADHAQPKATQVLGLQLTSATRDMARTALKAAGAKATREENQYWYDLYDASSLLDGAETLSVGYSLKDGRLGVIEYNFPNHMDTGAVQRVGEMVASKYGPPNKATGDVSLGEVKYVWNLKDGVNVIVSRGWPDTTVFLTYRVITISDQIDVEFEAEKKAKTEAAAKNQTNNF